MAQVCVYPAEIAIAVRPVPRSGCEPPREVAALGELGIFGRPNCPEVPSPQHLTNPSSRITQEWTPPAETAMAGWYQ